MKEIKKWLIHTRNQAGTTNYYIGEYRTKEEARQKALKGYSWYRSEPEKYSIIYNIIPRD